MSPSISMDKYHSCLDTVCPIQANGQVTKVIGLVIEALGPVSRMGTVCDIYTKEDHNKIAAEVLGFRDNHILMMPLEETTFSGKRFNSQVEYISISSKTR